MTDIDKLIADHMRKVSTSGNPKLHMATANALSDQQGMVMKLMGQIIELQVQLADVGMQK